MTDRDSKECLNAFGQLFIEARDAAIDEAECILDEGKGDEVIHFIQSSFRQKSFGGEDLINVIKYFIDKYIYELAYKIQDSRLEKNILVAVKGGSDQIYVVNEVSDGFAGEFMSEEGWIAKSKHGRNPYGT